MPSDLVAVLRNLYAFRRYRWAPRLLLLCLDYQYTAKARCGSPDPQHFCRIWRSARSRLRSTDYTICCQGSRVFSPRARIGDQSLFWRPSCGKIKTRERLCDIAPSRAQPNPRGRSGKRHHSPPDARLHAAVCVCIVALGVGHPGWAPPTGGRNRPPSMPEFLPGSRS
jgi:hypothetical protein